MGFTGNAAIGVSWQIFLVVHVFIGSLFTGMGVLVARFVGRNEPELVNRVVYQAFLTAAILSIGILAPIGYFLAPTLLDLVNATPAVQAEALPYIRVMFVFSFGMMVFFMLGGGAALGGDARTPLGWGFWMTVLNLVLNVILIRGFGPIPGFGTLGAAMGTVIAAGIMMVVAAYSMVRGRWVIRVQRGGPWRPDPAVIRQLFRFGLPTGIQGVAMNIGGVILLRFIGSLQAKRRGAGGVLGRLHPAVFARDLDFGRDHGGDGGGGGAESWRGEAGKVGAGRACCVVDRDRGRRADRGRLCGGSGSAPRGLWAG